MWAKKDDFICSKSLTLSFAASAQMVTEDLFINTEPTMPKPTNTFLIWAHLGRQSAFHASTANTKLTIPLLTKILKMVVKLEVQYW